MKKLQWVIRISLLLIIVLLGLTIIAPEWLELKDLFFTPKPTYEEPKAYKPGLFHQLLVFFSSIADTIIAITSAPGKLLSGIHHIIVLGGIESDEPDHPLVRLFSLFWTIGLYAIFLSFASFLYFFSNDFINKLTTKYNQLRQVSHEFPSLFKLTSTILIFSFSLLVWWLIWSIAFPFIF